LLSGATGVEALVADMERSDAELVEASKRGERDAFGALIERYQGVVCAVSYSRTGDRALSEDVAQDTFIAAWRQLDQLREPGRLRSWLCGIARNLARKARRRSGREAPLDRALVFDGANPFDEAARAESEQVVRDALSRVPEIYRDVLVLYYRGQRSVRDVAAALGLSEAAAQQRLARGRQYLADGVTDLVERSLHASRAARNLAPLVLATLPVFAPSRVEAASPSHGGTMTKLALVAAALIAAGTTAYVVHQPTGDASPAVASVEQAAPTPRAVPAPAIAPAPHPAPAVLRPPADPSPSPSASASADDDELAPRIDRATIERTGLYRGPSRGPDSAPVTIAVFTDALCPYCVNMLGSLDQLWDEYPGKLRLVVKQLPVHAEAVLAAEAAFAADAQGKFWELNDLMYAHSEDLSRDGLVALAERAGLDVAAFRAALDRHEYGKALDADRATAAELAVRSTPTFMINGKRVEGLRPMAQLRAAIDEALAEL
jgi:RNA polymerase sigma factor (sigma-70 family)